MSFIPNTRPSLLYRRFLAVVCLAVLIFLVWKDTAPTGELRLRASFGEASPFVSQVVPVQRARVVSDLVEVVDEPVYTTLRYPRPFKTGTVSFDFENPDQLFVLAGPQISPAETYDLSGLNHPDLNTLMQSNTWEVRRAEGSEGGEALWQRRSGPYVYASLAQFWEQLPDQERSAYFQAEWQRPYLPDFGRVNQPSQQRITVPLRGAHRFYVATALDVISFRANLADMNFVAGADALTISLKNWAGEVMAQDQLEDDGNSTDDGRVSSVRQLDFSYTGLESPGVYEVTIETTSDVIIRDIMIDAPYAVVKGHVSIAGGPLYARAFGEDPVGVLHLRSNARVLSAQTDHVDSAQTLHIGEEALLIEEPFTVAQYRFPDTRRFLLKDGYDLSLERGNISIDGQGVFAFSQSAYFSPLPWAFDGNVDPATFEISYIVTNYVMPQSLGHGLYRASIPVDFSQLYAPEKSLRLQIAMPGLQTGQTLRLRALTADLRSDPITPGNFFTKLRNFIDREL